MLPTYELTASWFVVEKCSQSSRELVTSQTGELADWTIRGLVNSPKCIDAKFGVNTNSLLAS